ncbi:hypothetical protein P7K49_005999 [Saguinus oedipus]|uniref:Uncharacterized protein n=1 Tax=Saguinus oedipus TaxID=9490 RepID=A0ABQ9W3L0_SAGOE|nr:hypothetical protein P7K49_005999 [Saguinus oedipus]
MALLRARAWESAAAEQRPEAERRTTASGIVGSGAPGRRTLPFGAGAARGPPKRQRNLGVRARGRGRGALPLCLSFFSPYGVAGWDSAHFCSGSGPCPGHTCSQASQRWFVRS